MTAADYRGNEKFFFTTCMLGFEVHEPLGTDNDKNRVGTRHQMDLDVSYEYKSGHSLNLSSWPVWRTFLLCSVTSLFTTFRALCFQTRFLNKTQIRACCSRSMLFQKHLHGQVTAGDQHFWFLLSDLIKWHVGKWKMPVRIFSALYFHIFLFFIFFFVIC